MDVVGVDQDTAAVRTLSVDREFAGGRGLGCYVRHNLAFAPLVDSMALKPSMRCNMINSESDDQNLNGCPRKRRRCREETRQLYSSRWDDSEQGSSEYKYFVSAAHCA